MFLPRVGLTQVIIDFEAPIFYLGEQSVSTFQSQALNAVSGLSDTELVAMNSFVPLVIMTTLDCDRLLVWYRVCVYLSAY